MALMVTDKGVASAALHPLPSVIFEILSVGYNSTGGLLST
jgi:hypothetical protein